MVAILAVACGGVVGFVLSLTGSGGSAIAVPLLVYVVGLEDPHRAIGTSSLIVAVNAYANLIPHAYMGNVCWRIAIKFTSAGIIGAIIGSELGKRTDGQQLLGLFGALLLFVAVVMLMPKGNPLKKRKNTTLRKLFGNLFAAGLAAGGLAGYFGVGGGFLVVPSLLITTQIGVAKAIGTSLFSVGGFGLITSINYARAGNVEWVIALYFMSGGIMGGWLGVRIMKMVPVETDYLNVIFAMCVLMMGLYILIKYFYII